MKRLKALGPYLLSTIVLAVMCTVLSSYFVQLGLQQTGMALTSSERLSMIGHDLIGMGPMFFAFIAIGLAIALPAGHGAMRVVAAPPALTFSVAGAVCMAVMLFLMEQVFFDLQIIAGARSTSGMAAMVVAGALAGLVYARLKR